jgi:hypothetical protein
MDISCLDVSAASRIPDDLNTFFQTLQVDQGRLWFLAGVKDVVIPQEELTQLRLDPEVAANIARADGYTLEATASPDLPSHALVVMKDYLAKATLVPRVEYFSQDKAVLKRLADLDWNPRESVLLVPTHARLTAPMKASGKVPPDQVDLETYTPNEIVVKAQSTLGAYLLINDQYDSDWQVQVNGRAAELLRADYILRAVQIPPGDSTISMHYVAHYHVAGLNLPAVAVNIFSDAAMLAAWLIAGLALLRGRLAKKTEDF